MPAQTTLRCVARYVLALLALLLIGGCSVQITRVQNPPSLKGSDDIATFDTPSYPSKPLDEQLPATIAPFDGFWADRSEMAGFTFTLTYQSRWYDYSWESVIWGMRWQQVRDPESGRVYIEAVNGPMFAINVNRKEGRRLGHSSSDNDTLTTLQLRNGYRTGWREINGLQYQTITFSGYMVVSTQSFAGTMNNANGSESVGFKDRDGWAMYPIEIELCADLTATGRFLEEQKRGRLDAKPTINPIVADIDDEDDWIPGNDEP